MCQSTQSVDGNNTNIVSIGAHDKCKEINGVLGHDSAVKDYTGPGTTKANEMKYVMNHAFGAARIDYSTFDKRIFYISVLMINEKK